MPSKSEKQKNFFGAVMGAKKGQQGVSGEAKKVAKKMPKKKIKEFLKTKNENEESKPKEEEEQSVLKKMKKGGGKATFKGPNVKERKPFAPPTRTHKSKKGKGSYDRKNKYSQDEEIKTRLDPKCREGYKKQGTKIKGGIRVNNCVEESTSIIKFLEAIMSNNHAEAHKHLKNTINKKIQDKIVQEIETPLF
jgi:hypothetical protein